MPYCSPDSEREVTTVTPLGNRDNAARNSSGLTGIRIQNLAASGILRNSGCGSLFVVRCSWSVSHEFGLFRVVRVFSGFFWMMGISRFRNKLDGPTPKPTTKHTNHTKQHETSDEQRTTNTPHFEIPLDILDNRLNMSALDSFFSDVTRQVNAELDWLIPEQGQPPQKLRDAIRWSLLAGGKHFRPALVFAVGRAFECCDEQLVRTAAAIEMIHTYSLIHDDLPSMDDDDLRRGRATCHKKFGEATAILAGDTLQVLAFQVISEDERLSGETRIRLINGLSRAAAKMVIGQQLDLDAEGKDLSTEDIEHIHRNKTGALICASAEAGAIIGGANDDEIAAVRLYGERLGLIFQITDDLLDITQTTEELGKTAGKDAAAAKATYPAVMGIDAAKRLAENVHADVVKAVGDLGRPSELLIEIADFILERRS